METRPVHVAASHKNFVFCPDNESGGELAQKRLDAILAANAEIAREKSLFGSEREKILAGTTQNPLSPMAAFAYFGLLLGTFPPLAVFARFITEKGAFRSEDLWVFGVIAILNLITAIVGYFSGKIIGRITGELEKFSWSYMLFSLPFFGILWGMLTGAAGGFIIFFIGAIFGAAIGAMVGGVALPAFAIFHRLLKNGDQIDCRHFLPLAFGITFIISAFILGL